MKTLVGTAADEMPEIQMLSAAIHHTQNLMEGAKNAAFVAWNLTSLPEVLDALG